MGDAPLPRLVTLSFALGAGLLVAGVLLVVLDALGVEQVGMLGWAAVIVVAAVLGGLVARAVVPRLLVRGDRP